LIDPAASGSCFKFKTYLSTTHRFRAETPEMHDPCFICRRFQSRPRKQIVATGLIRQWLPSQNDSAFKARTPIQASFLIRSGLNLPMRETSGAFVVALIQQETRMTQVAASPLALGSTPHLHALAMGWKLLLFRGICAIAFGAIAITMPLPTVATLIWMIAAFAVIDGVFALAAAISGKAKAYAPTWWLVLVGVLSIVAGIAIFSYPALSLLLMLKFIAFWAIFRGVFEIVGAIQLRKVINNEWALILGGVIDIAFGVYVLAFPGQSMMAIIMVLGIFAIISGISLVALSMRLKKHAAA